MSTISNSTIPREVHVGTFLWTVGKTIRNWWAAYSNWRLEQFAIARLQMMSDRELKDIGVSRAAIETLVKGTDHPMFNRYG